MRSSSTEVNVSSTTSLTSPVAPCDGAGSRELVLPRSFTKALALAILSFMAYEPSYCIVAIQVPFAKLNEEPELDNGHDQVPEPVAGRV
jgi:hypothetical protein